MLITLFAVALSFFLHHFFPDHTFSSPYLPFILMGGGGLIFLASLFLNISVMGSAQNLEQKLIPHLMENIRNDKPLFISRFILFTFVLLSFGAALLTSHLAAVNQLFFKCWFIAFAVTLDILNDVWKRSLRFLSPSFLVEHIAANAKAAIRNDKDNELWESLDNLSEIGLRSTQKSKLALSHKVIQNYPEIMKIFFEASKSIGHIQKNDFVKKKNGVDEASFAIFYLLQRMELLYDTALKLRLETVCRQIIISLGKIISYCSSYDISTATFPVHFLVKFGLKGLQHHFGEIGVLTTSTLLEISKHATQDVDLTYEELQAPFRAIINGLDALAKQSFKQDKTKPLKGLVYPLIELKNLFETEKMKGHRDTPIIIASIDQVIAEFQALQSIMQTIPSIPEEEDEVKNSE